MPIPEQAFTDDPPIRHTDGQDYAVLDPTKLDFTGPDATWGKKVTATRVRTGHKGDVIKTCHGSFEETPPYTVQQEGELIFINPKPDGSLDIFAPPNAHELLASNYKLIGGDINSIDGAMYLPTMRPVPILKKAVDRPCVIRDAFGPGRHDFLRQGYTLKLQEGKVSGIHENMFDLTWKETDPQGRILHGTKSEMTR